MRNEQRRLRTQRRAAERAAAKRVRRGHGTLAMLTGSALALIPGLAQRAVAQGADNGWQVDYGYSLYSEAKLPASKVSAGSRDRYDIDTHQFHVQAPIGAYFSVGLDVAYESMTGASPWYIEPDTNGDPVIVMTGASIEDARTDVLASVSFLGERSRTTLTGGTSLEDDYTSINFGFGREKDYANKNTTFSWGIGFATDSIEATPTSFEPDPDKRSKKTGSLSLGLAQVINQRSALQTSFTYQYADGYLSDPYKLVNAGGVNREDRRPGTRSQIAWLTRYRHHFERVRGSLHADYRLYWDSWEVLSHTIDLGWYQDLFDRVTLAPTLRYYSQSAAGFYAPYFAAGLDPDADASSDYRLSPYGAISAKLRAELRLPDIGRTDLRLAAEYEYYMSGGEYAVSKVSVENPALVDFSVLMISLKAGF
jgi:hypothetical protein